jgi:xylulokinase
MYLGIDVGTSAVKAVLVDGRQRHVAEASVPLATETPGPGLSEQRPEAWREAATLACRSLREGTREALGSVRAIGLSGQMHALVALGADDRPLRSAILWNDARAAAEAAEIAHGRPDLARIAGVRCMASFVAPKWRWMQRREPDLARRTRRLLAAKDWLRLWLTGEAATDPVDAAGAWLLDEAARTWSAPILEAVGLDRSLLPPVIEGDAAAGRLRADAAGELGLPPGIPVAAGTGDAAAGAIGLGQIGDGDAFVSLGTSGQLFVTTAAYRPAVETMVHAYAHGLPGRWFQMAALLNGASALAWWAGVCRATPQRLAAEAAAMGKPDADAPFFLPYLSGERTPHDDPHATGLFAGLRTRDTRADLTRAVMEGVAFCFADARSALEASGTAIGPVTITGGGARSRFWVELIADAIERPVLAPARSATGPAFGAARLARIAAGDGDAASVCRPPRLSATIDPDAAGASRVASRFAIWRRLYAERVIRSTAGR